MYIERYQNGNIKRKSFWKDTQNWYCITYYENEMIKTEINKSDEWMNNNIVKYHENGTMKYKEIGTNNHSKSYVEFYKNGNTKINLNYKDISGLLDIKYRDKIAQNPDPKDINHKEIDSFDGINTSNYSNGNTKERMKCFGVSGLIEHKKAIEYLKKYKNGYNMFYWKIYEEEIELESGFCFTIYHQKKVKYYKNRQLFFY